MKTKVRAAAVVVVGAILAGTGTSMVVAAEEPVAMVSLVEGTVTSVETGEEPRTLEARDCLRSGTRIEVATDSMAQILFFEGKRFELGAEVAVTLTQDGFRDLEGEPRRLADVRIGPAIASLAEKAGTRTAVTRIRGHKDQDPDKPWLIPGQNDKVLADELVLRFSPQRGAERYVVSIRNGETVFQEETTATTVPVPAGVLEPGKDYYWTVDAIGADPQPGREGAVFRTLKQHLAEERALLAEQVRVLDDPGLRAYLAEVDHWLGLASQ